jgi:hypothetical protein
MTKLISGRVHKVPSANVSAERYQFLEISEAEPDLGLPSQLGQVFTSDLSGNRYWVRLDTANVTETTNQYFTNVRVLQAVDPKLTTANVTELTNQYFTNVRVLQAVDPKLTTANVTELTNLYFTAERAIAALQGNNVVVNNLTVSGDLEVQGNLVSINTTTLNVEDKNILLANGAANAAAADNAGITIAGANAEIKYLNSGDLFNINKNVKIDGNLTITGNITSNTGAILFVPNSSGDGNGYGTMRLIPDNNPSYPSQHIVLDPTAANHIHIRAGGPQDNSSARLFLGGENSNFQVAEGANPPVYIAANNFITEFATNGTAIFPSTIDARGNVVIDGTFVGNGLIIRNIVVSDEILTGNILGQGFTSNTIVVSETLTANVIRANAITATEWNGIYTANVTESPNRLYYTNDRVFSFVTGMSIGDLYDVANIYTYPTAGNVIGIQEGQALVWNGNVFIPVFVNSEVANVADLAVKVLNLENQSTANVREASSNLYFTNTRVLDAISLSNINPNNINANNIVVDSITANIWNRIYTANVIETSGNLYFTTERARQSVSNSTGVYYNQSAGIFSIGQDVAITSDVQFRDVTLSGNLFVLGNVALLYANTLQINDPLLQLGLGNPGDQWDLGFVGHYLDGGQRHAGIIRDATDGKFKFFSNTTVEPGNVNYIDTSADSFRLSVVVAQTFEGNVVGTVSSLDNHTTDSLKEGTANLYFTTGRVVQTVTPLLTTANVLELTNQYFTNVRVLQAVEPLLTTSNVAELNNQYFTNVRVLQAVDPKLTTANVLELTNLYFTNARVLSNVEQMSINVLADVDITGVAVNATLVWDGTKFVPGSTDTSLRSNFANTAGSANVALLADRANVASLADRANVASLADLANLVSSLSNHNTSNLAEGTNLYYTNSRVLASLVNANVLVADLTAAGNLVANGLVIRGINVNDNVLTGNITITNIGAANVINANLVSSQQWQGLYTANVIESPTNLYFTNSRVRTAFLPGKGIAISGDGVITNTGSPFEYNTGIDGSGYANVLSTMSNLVRFSAISSRDRFLLRSLHITNVSDVDAAISGNVLYATGNTAFFANLLPVPVGGAVELMLNTQLFQPNDIVNLQGFTSTGVATSNLLQAVYTFETFSQDNTYQGTGQTLSASNTDILVYDSTSTFSIVESIKVVNLDNRIVPVRVYWADANNVIKAHLAFNTPIPPNSSFETISTPKRILTGDKLFARFNNAPNNAVSVFISARLGYNYAVSGIVSNVTPSGTASVSFSSSETDGTLLYYTIE